jgi:hypothetical protein
MENIKLLINKDDYPAFEKAVNALTFGKVAPSYKQDAPTRDTMYIFVEAGDMNSIIRIAFMAGYMKKDLTIEKA